MDILWLYPIYSVLVETFEGGDDLIQVRMDF
jgi:hypothetical protein